MTHPPGHLPQPRPAAPGSPPARQAAPGAVRRRWTVATRTVPAGILAAVLALAACAPPLDGPVREVADRSSTPSPAPADVRPVTTPPAEPPARPAAMERSDAAGAAAAAEYFLDLYPYAMLTGDLAEWDRISARGCVFCAVFRSTVAHTYDVGGRFTGGALTHQPGTVLNQDPVIGGYLVEVHYEVSPGMELDADDEPVAPVLAETATAYVDTVYSYDGWTLVELGTDPRYALFGPPMHPISEVAPTQHAPGP